MWFKKDKSQKSTGPTGLARVPGLRFFLILLVLCGLVVGGAAAMRSLDIGVQKGKFGPVVRYVGAVLEDPPPWMPGELCTDIGKSILPNGANYNDPELTAKVDELATANPWVRQVISVSRRMSARDSRIGLIVLVAKYRQPVATVRTDTGLVYVDMEGVRLPDGQSPQYMKYVPQGPGKPARQVCYLHPGDASDLEQIHYIEIQGVSAVTPQVGQKWEAEDLADGLKLVKLMCRQTYVNQIAAVDVRNSGGRINRQESFLRMVAKDKPGAGAKTTEILFGQFPGREAVAEVPADPKDWPPGLEEKLKEAPAEIPSDRKLLYLDHYAKSHGGMLAGKNRQLDLRYDDLHISND
jgi:hypothetical protein